MRVGRSREERVEASKPAGPGDVREEVAHLGRAEPGLLDGERVPAAVGSKVRTMRVSSVGIRCPPSRASVPSPTRA